MSAFNRQSVSAFQCPKYRFFTILSLFFLLVHYPRTIQALSFNYPDFSNPENLNFSGDAFSSNGIISLTKTQADSIGSVGRVVYAKEFQLWEHATGKVADFITHYSFTISMLKPPTGGDGLTFFLTPYGSHIPDNSGGSCLGLIGSCEDFNRPAEKSVVAIEIDTYQNNFDPSDNHIGIDINSIRSVTNITWGASLRDGTKGHMWFIYDHVKKEVTAYLTFLDNPVYDGEVTLSYGVDLTEILPEWVTVVIRCKTGLLKIEVMSSTPARWSNNCKRINS